MLVEFMRRAKLLDESATQHRHTISHGHRLDLVVRHIDGRGGNALVQINNLRAGGHA